MEIGNVTVKADGDDIIIRIAGAGTSKGTPSSTGKMTMIGSTHGFVPVSGFKSDKDRVVRISLNAGI